MIENQEQANARANEIAGKYGLVDAFRHQSAGEIAFALWEAAKTKLAAADHESAREILELICYLSNNYYYSYHLAVVDFELGNYEESLEIAERGLDLSALSPPLESEAPTFTDAEKSLYGIIVKSLVTLTYYEEAVQIFDSNSESLLLLQDAFLAACLALALVEVGRFDDVSPLLEYSQSYLDNLPPEQVIKITDLIQYVINILNSGDFDQPLPADVFKTN